MLHFGLVFVLARVVMVKRSALDVLSEDVLAEPEGRRREAVASLARSAH